MPQPRKSASSSPRRPTAVPTTPDDVLANLAAVRERLISSLTLTTDRLQETVDDAVRRGRMTRKDAEELLAQLISAGRQQTEALLVDLEQLLGRGRATDLRTRAAGSGDAVRRTVDRARRRVGIPGFPILDYDELTAAQISKQLGDLTPAELRKVRDHERRHAGRKSVLAAIDRKLG
jgi:polyhydroxyalkanoate synthesis regulator phasin